MKRFRYAYEFFVVLMLLLFAHAFYWIFLHSPMEAQMGIVQKIFYFHVPSAISMFLGLSVCAGSSVIYLVFSRRKKGRGLWAGINNFFVERRDNVDALARSGAELGLIYASIVLVTGPLWGRKAWGTYWEWDPRLTLTLLVFLIYVAYLFLRAFAAESESRKRIAAGLGALGFADVPLIHYAVQMWGGTHPNVMGKGGGGIKDPTMQAAFMISMATMYIMFGLLLYTRYSIERQQVELDRAYARLIDYELGEPPVVAASAKPSQ
ncbi:MAG: cytochrome c biogenesis protein [Myxococcales bacterium]|nr:cytochrome c biogenesis protein [Myxococcales bacterium]